MITIDDTIKGKKRGRPTSGEKKRNGRFILRIPQAEQEANLAYAESLRMSLALLFREAIRDLLSRARDGNWESISICNHVQDVSLRSTEVAFLVAVNAEEKEEINQFKAGLISSMGKITYSQLFREALFRYKKKNRHAN